MSQAAEQTWQELSQSLQEWREQGLCRQRTVIDSANGRQIILCQGPHAGRRKKLINWASNDYLGLSGHRRVKNAAARALRSYGAGAGASRLLAGGLRCHHRLEQRLAHWLGTEDCLVTGSGYQANLAVLVALASSSKDVLILDRRAHASTYDGAQLAAASLRRFAHNDVDDLARVLEQTRDARRRLVCVESVYSMDGDEAPLLAIADCCRAHGALLVVDEDHALGVLGPGGRGLCAELGFCPDVLVGTCSKALGAQGGFIAGRQVMIEHCVNRGRSFIFSTAPVPAAMGAAVAALDVLADEPDLPQRLIERSLSLRQELQTQGWSIAAGRSPIIPIIVGTEAAALELSAHLAAAGHYAPAIRPPTVPAQSSRLRITPSLAHTPADLRRLLRALAAYQADASSDTAPTGPARHSEKQA